MNRVTLDGKTYIKASVLARDIGYTTDYVGQLCRAGKVDAQLVGRSWYVVENSLREHKSNRYRSSKIKSQEEIKKHIADSRGVETTSRFYRGSRIRRNVDVSYNTDNSELLPPLQQDIVSKRLPIELDNEEGQYTRPYSGKYHLPTPKKHEFKSRGILSIRHIHDEDSVREQPQEDTSATAPKPVPNTTKQGGSKIYVHDNKNTNLELDIVRVGEKQEHHKKERSLRSLYILTSVTAVAIALAFILVGMETQLWATGNTLTIDYTFSTNEFFALIYTVI